MDMDIEVALLKKALSDPKIWTQAAAVGITESDLDDHSHKRVWRFVEEYMAKHGSMPAVDLVESVCRVELESPDAEPSWLISEFQNRKLHRAITKTMGSVTKMLASNDPMAAMSALRGFVESSSVMASARPPRTIFEHGPAVLEQYGKVRGGVTGMPYIWPRLNKATNGLWKGQVSLFVARPGVGKTFVATIQARYLWQQGCRVLVISPEMGADELAERFYLVDTQMPYGALISGTLSDFQVRRLETRIDELKDETGLWVVDGEDDLSQASLESAIDLVQPDLVAIDAIYMLPFGGKDKFENTDRVLSWMRKISRKKNIAIVAFHQQSRDAEKTGKGAPEQRLGTIALTDQAAWDAYNIFSLYQDADMKADRIMRISPLKVRRGSFFSPFDVFWDFDAMKFHELDAGDPVTPNSDPKNSHDDDIPF